MSELKDDLRSTTEDITADAAKLQQIESKKGRMQPGDPSLVNLAKQAEDLGEQIAAKTSVELDLTKEAAG